MPSLVENNLSSRLGVSQLCLDFMPRTVQKGANKAYWFAGVQGVRLQ
ncbi:MAG: hypothetical protein JWM58_1473 [Rhizobium sp.]|nr:hypothetical protein [Rhizobium sp.]